MAVKRKNRLRALAERELIRLMGEGKLSAGDLIKLVSLKEEGEESPPPFKDYVLTLFREEGQADG